jgi:hypothetical protein
MTKTLIRTTFLFATCVLLATAFIGCSWSIGGGKEGANNTRPTRGQELIDLQRARDQGAITPDQYEDQKRRILSR